MQPPNVLGTILGLAEGSTREIRYVQAEPDGRFSEDDWVTFRFRGRSVFHLRTELANRLNVRLSLFTLMMCVRAGPNALLTPLVVDLPDRTPQLHAPKTSANPPTEVHIGKDHVRRLLHLGVQNGPAA